MYHADGTVKATKDGIRLTPSTTGVYIFRSDNAIVYIGKAVNIRARLLSHLQSTDIDKKEAAIFAESSQIDYLITDSEFKALVVEAYLISTIKPKYNVRWRDDKSYLYIKVTMGDEYPKVSLARGQDVGKISNSQSPISDSSKTPISEEKSPLTHSSARVFGPFSSTHSAESVLRYLRRIVPYCTQRTISKHACFYHKIGQCSPCPNLIEQIEDKIQKSKEKRKYRANIKKLCTILDGDISKVKKEFERELRAYSASQNFEAAIRVRDAMRRLEFMIIHGSFQLDEYESYNRSEQSMEALMTLLKPHFTQLKTLHRIECYDNSTLGFSNSTASMVVFTDGLVDKREYKRFKMKKQHDNDFDMMREIIRRRAAHTNWPQPDLIVIDGGVPQLKAVMETLTASKGQYPLTLTSQNENSSPSSVPNHQLSDTPIIGIAKRPDRLVIPTPEDPSSEFVTLRPKPADLGFRMIQAIRDEAHRFAKNYHVLVRKRTQFTGSAS